jgi:hypothetical protein
MFTFSISCYNSISTNEVLSTQFYVLSKGLNSGKPLEKPCPNCFVITVKNDEEREFLFWLCWGLWQSKKFHHLHTGSVIPFIRLHEFKPFIKEQAATAFAEKEQYNKNVKALQKLEQLEKNYKQNLLLIMDAKRAIFQRATARR